MTWKVSHSVEIHFFEMDKPCEWVKVWRLTSFFSLLKSSVLVAAYFFKSPEKRIEWVIILQGKVKKTTKSYEKFHHVSAVKTTKSFPSTKLRFSYNFFWLYDFIMLLNLRFHICEYEEQWALFIFFKICITFSFKLCTLLLCIFPRHREIAWELWVNKTDKTLLYPTISYQ